MVGCLLKSYRRNGPLSNRHADQPFFMCLPEPGTRCFDSRFTTLTYFRYVLAAYGYWDFKTALYSKNESACRLGECRTANDRLTGRQRKQ